MLRRVGEWSDGAIRNQEEDLENVKVITGLDKIVEEVRNRNGSKNES